MVVGWVNIVFDVIGWVEIALRLREGCTPH
jgi:hypothetical protein